MASEKPSFDEGAPIGYISPFLFRGQSDHLWCLSTTLERYIGRRMSVQEYYNTIHAAKPQIETFIRTEWVIPTPPEYEKWLAEQDTLV